MNKLAFVTPIDLKYFKMYPDVEDIVRGTEQSACADVRVYFGTHEREITAYNKDNVKIKYFAYQDVSDSPHFIVLHPGDRAMIPTGIILDIPKGHSVRVHPRSGIALKNGVTLCNSQGIIDSDYVEPFYITAINLSNAPVRIEHGMRLAQLELVEHPAYHLVPTNIRPGQKTDRTGGFGSTGTK
jgi:dUTP pyrophosphatase